MELPVDTLIEIKTTEIDKIRSMDIAQGKDRQNCCIYLTFALVQDWNNDVSFTQVLTESTFSTCFGKRSRWHTTGLFFQVLLCTQPSRKQKFFL